MEALVALGVLALFAALAARFGYDSRDGIRTKEYDLAATGMTWLRDDDAAPRPSRTVMSRSRQPIVDATDRVTETVRLADTLPATASRERNGWSAERNQTAIENREEWAMHTYPTLALIDQALGPDGPGYAASIHAASLESYALALADEYWSERVWLTGCITSAALTRVSEPLALQRQELERATWHEPHFGIKQEQASADVAA